MTRIPYRDLWRPRWVPRFVWRLYRRVRGGSSYDNWLRGYVDGMEAGLRRAEDRQRRGERIR